MTFRIGHGYDAHRFAANRKLILGGVTIPHDKGLEGHSDADVLTHAIMDAILGALGEKDIGHQFPPGDPKWKDCSSIVMLGEVMQLVRTTRASVINIDATLLLEAPKIAPHADAMREKLARAMGITVDRVSIKATTNEGLGAIGRGEGAAAHAVVLMKLEREE